MIMSKNNYAVTINETKFHYYFARDKQGSEAKIFYVNDEQVTRSEFYEALKMNLNDMRYHVSRALNLLLT